MRFDERYIARVTLDPRHDTGRYPFTLPVVCELAGGDGIDFDERVTCLVGDNGTGKSTIIEAIAVASGFTNAYPTATSASPGERRRSLCVLAV